MNFFKKLFSKNTVPPIKNIPSIEPVVIQAVENLFQNEIVQEEAFKSILEFKKDRQNTATPITILALLKYSKGDLELFRKSAWQSHPHFWMDEISPIFRTMEDAERWVKSLAESKN
jgi:hypothetical protein